MDAFAKTSNQICVPNMHQAPNTEHQCLKQRKFNQEGTKQEDGGRPQTCLSQASMIIGYTTKKGTEWGVQWEGDSFTSFNKIKAFRFCDTSGHLVDH